MKKLLLPILAVLFCAVGMMAQTTITFADTYGTTTQAIDTKTIGSYSFTFSKAEGSTAPAFNKAGDIRLYAKNTMTIKSGEPMTSIVFTLSTQGKNQLSTINASTGTIATQAKGDETVTWSGNATEITFTVGATNDFGANESKAAGQFDFTVCTIAGGGGTVTPPTPPTPADPVVVNNIKELIDLKNTTDEITFNGELTVVYAQAPKTSKINLYVTDSSNSWLLLYGLTSNTYKNGDVIPAGAKGKYTLYGDDVPEFIFNDNALEASTKSVTPVEPEMVIVADIDGEPINSFVEVPSVSISGLNGKNATIEDASGSFPLYNSLGISVAEGTNLTIRGFNSSFKGKGQFVPCEILSGSGREIVATPTFSVESGAVVEGTLVEIKCATEGATIYYTLDNTNPNADSEVYSSAIEITSDVTIKALAVKDGMDDSSIATATYTIKVEPKNVALFDFAQPTTLTPAYSAGTEADNANTYINTDEVVFSEKGVTVTNVGSQPYGEGKTSTCGRLYFQSGGAVQLRVYNYGILTITAPANNKITKIEFAFNNTNGGNINGGNNQVTVSGKAGSFEPASSAQSVEFKAKGTVQINQLNVYCENDLSGVEDIIAGEEDNNAPVEYYNINGVRVENPAAGLYIKRQGSKVSKVIIR